MKTLKMTLNARIATHNMQNLKEEKDENRGSFSTSLLIYMCMQTLSYFQCE